MNKPGTFEYIVGNYAAFAVLACGTWASAMSCCAPEHTTPVLAWLIPVTGLVLTGKAARARRRVVAYKAWSKRWNTMAGPSGAGLGEVLPRARRRIGWGRGGAVLWCALVLWLMVHDRDQGTPVYGVAALGFMSLSVVGVGAGLVKLGRRVARRAALPRAGRGGRGHVVTICPGVPLRSPDARALNDALPDYCLAIMGASGIALPR